MAPHSLEVTRTAGIVHFKHDPCNYAEIFFSPSSLVTYSLRVFGLESNGHSCVVVVLLRFQVAIWLPLQYGL